MNRGRRIGQTHIIGSLRTKKSFEKEKPLEEIFLSYSLLFSSCLKNYFLFVFLVPKNPKQNL